MAHRRLLIRYELQKLNAIQLPQKTLTWLQFPRLASNIHFTNRMSHPDVAKVSQKLFDNGHYSQATLEAFKSLENLVKKIPAVTRLAKS